MKEKLDKQRSEREQREKNVPGAPPLFQRADDTFQPIYVSARHRRAAEAFKKRQNSEKSKNMPGLQLIGHRELFRLSVNSSSQDTSD